MFEMMVGKVISASNLFVEGKWIGLVVDQEAGKKWVDRDPCLEVPPPSDNSNWNAILVRVFGDKMMMTPDGPVRSSLPDDEPSRSEMVRWAYVQIKPSPSFYVVAGPDVESISRFIGSCRTIAAVTREKMTFLNDLVFLEEYLREDRFKNEKGYKGKFFKMLSEVLPKK